MKEKKGNTGVEKLFSYAENYPITPAAYMAVFLCISFIRNFMEGALEKSRSIGTHPASIDTTFMQMGVLFNLEWITLLAAIALAVRAATGQKIAAVMKVILFFYVWIAIVPFFDFFAYYPSGCSIEYLYTFKDYLNALAFFFVPFKDAGVCAGIRFEVFAAFIFCAAYVFIKTRSLLKSSSAALALYFLAVSSMAFPVFILLPALPFNMPSSDSFIKTFFFGVSYGPDFFGRVSLMIIFLLVPVLTAVLYLHKGAAEFKKTISSLFSPFALAFPALYLAGALQYKGGLELPFLSYPFDPAYLAAGLLGALLVGFFVESFSKQAGGFSASFIPALAGFLFVALSFRVFLVYVFIMSLVYLFYSAPFKLSRFKGFEPLFFALIFPCVFLSGYASVAGASFLSLNLQLAASIIPLCLFASLKPGILPKSAHASLMMLSCLMIPVAARVPSLFFPAIAAALISAAIVFIKIPDNRKKTLLYTLLSLFMVMLGVYIKFGG